LWLSCITDSLVEYFLNSWEYFQNDALIPAHRYDYYIKPLFISKYWKNELFYFPKLTGFEKIDWIEKDYSVNKSRYDKHHILIPITDLIEHYKHTVGTVKRFWSSRYGQTES